MSRRSLLALTVVFVLLTACASLKPQHASPTQAKASRAPVKTHDQPARQGKGPANPAVPNKQGVAAGEVGYFLDVLQGRLRQALDPGVIISRERNSIVLDFSQRIVFAEDETQTDDAGRESLLSLAKVLLEFRSALVSVRVDARDDSADARKLAQLRANAVERVLTGSGISAARIAAAVPGAAARNGNMHVEILLVPEIRSE